MERWKALILVAALLACVLIVGWFDTLPNGM